MLGKSLHLCFSKIHCLPTSFSLSLDEEEDEKQQEEMMKSFNSLYAAAPVDSFSEATSEPDLSFAVASSQQRFFVSAPGISNSILHSSIRPSWAVLEGGVPVRKYSPDPYVDFRESMEEMVRARRATQCTTTTKRVFLVEEWEYLHQLLICYLSLNPKGAHKFIIRAFADLVLSSS